MTAHRGALALTALAAAAATWIPAGVAAQEAGELVLKQGAPLAGDQYLAGGSVDVLARVRGDLLAAGGQVGVGADVDGDVLAVGGLVYVAATVRDDLRAAGGRVIVVGEVGDELTAVGGDVLLRRTGQVRGRALLAGGRVRLLGDVAKGLHAAAEVVEIDGAVGGDAVVWARQVVLGPSARIAGDLRVTSENPPRIAPGAVVAGAVAREAPRPEGGRAAVGRLLRGAALQLGLLLAAWAWLALAPVAAREAGRVGREEPALAMGMGVAVLFGLPVAALGLAVTVVGIPVAVAAVAAWVLVALAGYCAAAVRLGDALRRWIGRERDPLLLGHRLASTLAALLLLRALQAVPVLGVAVTLAALVSGAGSVARAVQLLRLRARARAAT